MTGLMSFVKRPHKVIYPEKGHIPLIEDLTAFVVDPSYAEKAAVIGVDCKVIVAALEVETGPPRSSSHAFI